MTKARILIFCIAVQVFSLLGNAQGNPTIVRVGAFPNITHPQPMVGKANGYFEKALGPQVKIDWKTFNAGPSAIEALFAGAIDMAYIGPNPTINGYVRSHGEALQVVAGAASGGGAATARSPRRRRPDAATGGSRARRFRSAAAEAGTSPRRPARTGGRAAPAARRRASGRLSSPAPGAAGARRRSAR